MKSPRIVALVAAVALAVMFGAVAFGQDGLLAGVVQPLVVNIEQQVPVDVTLAVPLEDGSVVTTTAPITVGIALQVKIDGSGVIAISTGKTDAAEVKVEEVASGGELIDRAGIPYSVETQLPVTLSQVQSRSAWDGKMTEIIAELTNNGDEELSFVSLSMRFYDKEGNLLEAGGGGSVASKLAPGMLKGVQVSADVAYADVARYVIEID